MSRSRKTLPEETRSGLKATWNCEPARSPLACSRCGATRSRVVPTGTVVSRLTTVPCVSPAADRLADGVDAAPVRARVLVDEQRRHGDDELGALGDGGGRVGRRAQAPAGDDLGERLLEAALAGKRRHAGVDGVDRARVDVAADDLVAGARDVGRQRQAHLAQRDDDRPHRRTVRRVRALSSTFSAQRTVCSPSSSDTVGESSSPSTKSQNASSSASSGSRRCSA